MEKIIKIKIIPSSVYSKNSYIKLLSINLSNKVIIKYNDFLCNRLNNNLIHYNWSESILSKKNYCSFCLSLIRMYFELRLNHFFNIKSVLTVHNIYPHDYINKQNVFLYKKYILKNFAGYIFLNENSKQEFINFYSLNDINNFVIISHGHYRDIIPFNLYNEIKQNKNNLLFFGQIRPYKNLENLIDPFLNDTNKLFKLSIVGKPNYNLSYFNSLYNLDYFEINYNYVDDIDLFKYILSSKAVVLPYKKILNSGSIFLALSLNRHVFVNEELKLYNLEEEIKSGYIIRYKDYNDLKFKFNNLISNSIMFNLERHNWNLITKNIFDFYQMVLKN